LWCLSVIPQGASASVVGGKTPTTASIIITTSEFTASAKEFAGSMTKAIELWDINFLMQNL
jgi:restriction endonuclease Mrr